MKKIFFLTTTLLFATSLQIYVFGGSSDNKLTKKQKDKGWQLLFDGKTLDGWSIKSGFATYKVDEGAIVGTTTPGSPNTFLCSDGEFADFELTFFIKLNMFFFNGTINHSSQKAVAHRQSFGPLLSGLVIE